MLPISQSLALPSHSNGDDLGTSSVESDKQLKYRQIFLILTIKNPHISDKYGTEDAYIVVESVKCDFKVELSIVIRFWSVAG